MTEYEPALRDEPVEDRPTAGEVGVHRHPMNVPLHNPGVSRNIAPQRLRSLEIWRDYLTGRELLTEDEEDAGGPGSATARRAEAPAGPGGRAAPGAARPEPSEGARAGRPRVVLRRRPRPGVLLAGAAALLLVLRRLLRRRGRRG